MDELSPTPAPAPTPDPELTDLQDQVRSLRNLLKLVLVSAFIASAALGLFLYRQTTLMKRQIDAQQVALRESQAKEREVVMRGIEVFREYGLRDPVFVTNILAKFGLAPASATNRPAGAH
jgi:hypothetical protein